MMILNSSTTIGSISCRSRAKNIHNNVKLILRQKQQQCNRRQFTTKTTTTGSSSSSSVNNGFTRHNNSTFLLLGGGTAGVISIGLLASSFQNNNNIQLQLRSSVTLAEATTAGGSTGTTTTTTTTTSNNSKEIIFDPIEEIKDRIKGIFGGGSNNDSSDDDETKKNNDESTSKEEEDEEKTTEPSSENIVDVDGGPGKKVIVPIDQDIIDELPIMDLDDVMKCNGQNNNNNNGKDENNKLLVTYDGIVYDVTEFIHVHPGGHDLLLTAAGLDLNHFFNNYTVHGQTDKAGQWLAPLAIGKLSKEDTIKAKTLSTTSKHIQKRMNIIKKARNKILFIALSLPLWITIRSIVTFIGTYISSNLGKYISYTLPITVPGFSIGCEPLQISTNSNSNTDSNTDVDSKDDETTNKNKNKNKNKNDKNNKITDVVIIGGGIAGCGAAWTLKQAGYNVTLYEARKQISGNARTFEWDFTKYGGAPSSNSSNNNGEDKKTKADNNKVKSCVSVTAWPPMFYKNYTALLDKLNIETIHQPLSWFLNSKIPGYEGTLWGADPTIYDNSLRKVFYKDFYIYDKVVTTCRNISNILTLKFIRPNDTPSMYDSHTGLGLLNPLNIIPLYSIYRACGGSNEWWNIIFTPYYTASFLVDELRPFPAVFGPLIEDQIPLLPKSTNTWQGKSKRSDNDANITTCVTWKDAGVGIREVFTKLVDGIDLYENTRIRKVEILDNGLKRVYDEYDNYVDAKRVIFACPCNAIGNMLPSNRNNYLENIILSTPVYADDHHPDSGHMHAIMHNDSSVIQEDVRDECLKRASNYVEVTQNSDDDKTINIENQYNFGVQTPGPGVYDLPLDKKPVMLISHSLGEGKTINKKKIVGTGNHARAHPLYSGWNVTAMLSLRLVQGKDGIYYCSNWTTPANCHDMSLLSGIVCAHAIGAPYPFNNNIEAKKDFMRLRDLMGF